MTNTKALGRDVWGYIFINQKHYLNTYYEMSMITFKLCCGFASFTGRIMKKNNDFPKEKGGN